MTPHTLSSLESPPAAGAPHGADAEHPSAHATLARDVERLFRASQPRLLRLARLRGIAPDAAEDVVQETLLEAWRHLDHLRDPARFDAWLDGICRNVCLRQQRAAVLATRHTAFAPRDADAEPGPDAPGLDLADLADPAAFDPAEELDRQDLQTLLDRALGHLPERAREALELCYLADLPQREAAERLCVSIGALEERLRRARKQLRQVLHGTLRPEAEAFGLALDVEDGKRETRIWCPFCATTRLALRVDGERHLADFSCPGCQLRLAGTDVPEILAGVSSPRAILSRQLVFLSDRYWSVLAGDTVTCPFCGAQAGARSHLLTDEQVIENYPSDQLPVPEVQTRLGTRLGMHMYCPRCGPIEANPLTHLVMDTPAVWRFWRDHPRMRSLPEYEVEHAGRPAVVSTFENADNTARLTVLTDRETLAILRVDGAAPDER